MQVIYIDKLSDFESYNDIDASATIGFFDGVHKGHKKIFSKLEKEKGVKIIVTFDYHPYKKCITTESEKIKILKKFNVDYLYIIRKNETNLNLDKEDFIKFLVKNKIKKIVTGPDFRFGKNAKGDVENLKSFFAVDIVEFEMAGNIKISSSNIRKVIEESNFTELEKELGKKYEITGIVVHGKKIGRKIGFPTANLLTENHVPGSGVYYTIVSANGIRYKAATNIGYKPTIDGEELTIESYRSTILGSTGSI